MTTAKTPNFLPAFRFPDPPSTPDEKMTAAKHLGSNGNAHHLSLHLGNPQTTIVGLERYVTLILASERADMTGVLYPDLLVAFNVDPVTYEHRNAYVISEQSKPPDFVLEIASRSTGSADANEKRAAYAALSIPEYWRFDETGQYHGARLAGDRLVQGRYEPILVEELDDGSLQGYSPALNLNLRWDSGQLAWYDPATNRPIATFADERQGRLAAEARANAEQETRIAAESRVRVLEAELARRNQDP